MSKKLKPRRRHNKFVRVLSDLYEFEYQIVYRIYKGYGSCVATTRFHLSQLSKVRAQLDFIDDINLSF